jgi:hypothetical protein
MTRKRPRREARMRAMGVRVEETQEGAEKAPESLWEGI